VQNCPKDLKWAVAGRSHGKLTGLLNEIKPLNEDRKPPGIVIADSSDFDALVSLAQSTRVVVSFAGPFAKYLPRQKEVWLTLRFGNSLVKACAENSTHYADITGETPW
jgi:short subunit dehydrogenase-like uncharacterized protein